MIPSSYLPDNEIAKLSARMLIEVGAIAFNSDTPYKPVSYTHLTLPTKA